jgi:hypothetical protein
VDGQDTAGAGCDGGIELVVGLRDATEHDLVWCDSARKSNAQLGSADDVSPAPRGGESANDAPRRIRFDRIRHEMRCVAEGRDESACLGSHCVDIVDVGRRSKRAHELGETHFTKAQESGGVECEGHGE